MKFMSLMDVPGEYYVANLAQDGDAKVILKTTITKVGSGSQYAMAGGTTCTCKSTNCGGTWDCETSLDGNHCSCSPCSGDKGNCEKTSTVYSIEVVRNFFNAIL